MPGAPEPADSASTAAPVEADASPVAAGSPPTGDDAGEETASAERSGISAESADSAALAVPPGFTWEALQAAEDAYQRSLAACWPHFAPLRAHRHGEALEFDEPMPGDWQLLNAMTQEWLLDRWESAAHEGIASTFRTDLYHALPPRQLAMVSGDFYSPAGEEEHATEQFTAKVPVITSARRRARLPRLLRGGDD